MSDDRTKKYRASKLVEKMDQLISLLKTVSILIFTTILISYQKVWSEDMNTHKIEIKQSYINKPFVGAKSAAGYLIISNHNDKELTLLQVSTALGIAMLHETTTTDSGVVKMEHLVKVNIPAGDKLIMQPGGIHIMIMGLSRALVVGETIPAILKFSDDVEMDIEFTVQESKKYSETETRSKHAH